MDGNIKMKTYENDFTYVVNHESGTIYNDITKFDNSKWDEAVKQYNSYPESDATVLIRGKDGNVVKRKGEDNYVAQNLAYLYNEQHEFPGTILEQAYSNAQIDPTPPKEAASWLSWWLNKTAKLFKIRLEYLQDDDLTEELGVAPEKVRSLRAEFERRGAVMPAGADYDF